MRFTFWFVSFIIIIILYNHDVHIHIYIYDLISTKKNNIILLLQYNKQQMDITR